MQVYLKKFLDFLFPPSGEALLARNTSPHFVHSCLRPQLVDGVTVLSDFKNPVIRALIHEAKFHGDREAQRLLSGLLSMYLKKRRIHDSVIVVPVPLSAARIRERGYNQVCEVAKNITLHGVEIDDTSLVRIKNTKPQSGLQKDKREKNVQGAFVVKHPGSISGKNILLVDDVLTTGATMRAAKAALSPHRPASITCIALSH